MGQFEKLVQRFLQMPVNFTYDELVTLLKGFGYEEFTKGKTSGSRMIFINEEIGSSILIHKPHPQKEVKKYMLKQVLESLTELELLNDFL